MGPNDSFSRTSISDRAHDASRGRILAFTAGATGIAVLLFAYLAVTWRSFSGITKVIDAFKEPFSDFIIYYYPMGEAIFRTGHPVDGFLYSPFIAIVMATFPPLGLFASLVLWGILQAFFVIFYLLLFRWIVPAGLQFQLLFVTLALSSYPLLLNLLAGQVSVFMIVTILGMLVVNERAHHAAGAGLLALAVSFKFYPIFFLAPFATRRDARFLLFATAACGTILFVVPGVLLGIGDTLRFYGLLLDSFRNSAWVAANPHSQYFPHLAIRLADATGLDINAYLPFLYLIAYGVAVVNVVFIFLVQRARLRHADLWSFQIVFLTIPFLLKTSWPHDFVFLSFTQALMVWQLLEGENTAPRIDSVGKDRPSRVGPCIRLIVTFLLVLLSIIFSNIVFFNLFGDFPRYGFYGFLFGANLLLLIASYVLLLPPALRQVQKPKAV